MDDFYFLNYKPKVVTRYTDGTNPCLVLGMADGHIDTCFCVVYSMVCINPDCMHNCDINEDMDLDWN